MNKKKENIFINHYKESIYTKQLNLEAGFSDLLTIGSFLVNLLNNGNKILFCGNGGSCSDAEHISTELLIQFRKSFPRRAIPGISLSMQTSTITAGGNDFGFEFIFSRTLRGIGKQDDCLFIFSTSGNSQNIIEAAKSAKELGLSVVCFLGSKPGKVDQYSDYIYRAKSEKTAIIQENHITAGHALVQYIEENL